MILRPPRSDDDDAIYLNYLGVGCATTLNLTEPTPRERAELRDKQPFIGFVELRERDD